MKTKDFPTWLSSPKTVAYFGKSFALRVEILSALRNRTSLAEVAHRFGVTPEAVYKHVRKEKKLGVLAQLEVD